MRPSALLAKAQKATALVENRIVLMAMRRAAGKKLAATTLPCSLNLGCGAAIFEAPWINIDLAPQADVHWDLTHPIPLPDGSCRLIYSEHVFEHFPPEQGAALLADCHRLLMPGGIIRIAMPNLERLAQKYLASDWKDQEWLKAPPYQLIQTPAEMFNVSVRWWGHCWVYDHTELSRRLRTAGFSVIHKAEFRQSDEPQLRNRETRPDSFLICEATRS